MTRRRARKDSVGRCGRDGSPGHLGDRIGRFRRERHLPATGAVGLPTAPVAAPANSEAPPSHAWRGLVLVYRPLHHDRPADTPVAGVGRGLPDHSAAVTVVVLLGPAPAAASAGRRRWPPAPTASLGRGQRPPAERRRLRSRTGGARRWCRAEARGARRGGRRVVVDADWADGMSARCGPGCDLAGGARRRQSALVHLVDLPDVGADVLRRLLAVAPDGRPERAGACDLRRRTRPSGAARPRSIGTPSRDSVHGDRGARDYLAAHAATIVECGDLASGAGRGPVSTAPMRDAGGGDAGPAAEARCTSWPRRCAAPAIWPTRAWRRSAWLALRMRRPLLARGRAGHRQDRARRGAGRGCSAAQLVRLQCYEGIDASQALYDWDFPRQILHLRAVEATRTGCELDTEEVERSLLRRAVPARPAGAAGAARQPGGAAGRRGRPGRRRVRGVPARGAVDLPGQHPRARHGHRRPAAGRGAHVQPHPRAARRAQAALPLPLDRPPRAGPRGRDRPHPAAGGLGAAGRAGHRARCTGCATAATCSSRPVWPRRSTGRGRCTRSAPTSSTWRGPPRPSARW